MLKNTGKTTVARHFAKILFSLGAVPGPGYAETTGVRLAHGGIDEAQRHLDDLKTRGGGVFFIDEAYQLTEGYNSGGRMVLDFLLAEVENLTGQVVFIFAGYRDKMRKLLAHNPGFASRMPYTLHFDDFSDDELTMVLQAKMDKYYKGAMGITGGPDGLYMRIAARRLGRGRGKEGFGNARAAENCFQLMRDRQAKRLSHERRSGVTVDLRLLTQEDIIGPNPSKALRASAAWKELQQMIGLQSVKISIQNMIDKIGVNYQRELQESPLVEVSYNRLFLGGPGTGKTTVAKLYGSILVDLGSLSDGEGKSRSTIRDLG